MTSISDQFVNASHELHPSQAALFYLTSHSLRSPKTYVSVVIETMSYLQNIKLANSQRLNAGVLWVFIYFLVFMLQLRLASGSPSKENEKSISNLPGLPADLQNNPTASLAYLQVISNNSGCGNNIEAHSVNRLCCTRITVQCLTRFKLYIQRKFSCCAAPVRAR